MKKHNLLGVFAVVLMAFALVFTFSCGGDEEPGPDAPVVTPSNNRAIASLVISKGAISTTAGLGGLKATATEGTAGLIELSAQNSTGADIVVTPTATNVVSAVAYAIGAGATAPASYTDLSYDATNQLFKATGVNFVDGQAIFLKTTAQDGSVGYYRMDVEIGKNAKLGKVTIGGIDAVRFGSVLTNWIDFSATPTGPLQRGAYYAEEKMPAAGFKVEIAAQDPDAKIWWVYNKPNSRLSNTITVGSNASGSDPASGELALFDGTAQNLTIFNDGVTDMAIKVVSGDKNKTHYYRLSVVMKAATEIKKGTVAFTAEATNAELIADSAWNAAQWIAVDRVNLDEMEPNPGMDDPDTQHTTAKVKLLWDNTGLWAMWEVSFHPNDEVPTRTASPDPSVGSAVVSEDTSNAHMFDTVELFVNERFQQYKEGNFGMQYRISCNNIYSGDPADGYTAMATLGKYRAWIDGAGTGANGSDIGYTVVMQIPWQFKTAAEADQVFTGGIPQAGAQIGVELQLNVVSDAGRDAILTWNGIGSRAYQNVRSYGIATLVN